MDFRQSNPTTSPRPATPSASAPANGQRETSKHSGRTPGSSKWLNILNVVLIFGVAILVAAVAFFFSRTGNDNEFKYVNTNDYQAVFLNNGQVYFGKVGTINGQYVELDDVYYLTQNNSTSSSSTTNPSYTLMQLGCQQIHYPEDQMLINRGQVTFWENLNGKGQVVTRINQLKKQGVDCSQVTSQTQASSNATTQNSTGTGTTNPTSTTNQNSSSNKQ